MQLIWTILGDVEEQQLKLYQNYYRVVNLNSVMWWWTATIKIVSELLQSS